MAFTYSHPRTSVTVDVVLFGLGARGRLQVLLIRRKSPPHRGRWALPGGFVDAGEDLEPAARRELQEETGLAVGSLHQLGAYGTPGRDPRGHTISVVFVGAALPEGGRGEAGDDAAACEWHSARRPPLLAFDHAVVLRDARRRLAELAASRESFARALFTTRQRKAAEAFRRAVRGAT